MSIKNVDILVVALCCNLVASFSVLKIINSLKGIHFGGDVWVWGHWGGGVIITSLLFGK